jgi:hypothetical protein
LINVYYNKKTVGIATYGFKINDLGLLNCPTINLLSADKSSTDLAQGQARYQ